MGRSNYFAQALHERLRLTVSLRPEGGNLLGLKANPVGKRFEFFAVERRSIVRAYRVWDTMNGEHRFHSRDNPVGVS